MANSANQVFFRLGDRLLGVRGWRIQLLRCILDWAIDQYDFEGGEFSQSGVFSVSRSTNRISMVANSANQVFFRLRDRPIGFRGWRIQPIRCFFRWAIDQYDFEGSEFNQSGVFSVGRSTDRISRVANSANPVFFRLSDLPIGFRGRRIQPIGCLSYWAIDH